MWVYNLLWSARDLGWIEVSGIGWSSSWVSMVTLTGAIVRNNASSEDLVKGLEGVRDLV